MMPKTITRRHFMTTCGLLGLAAVSSPFCPAAEGAARLTPSLVKATRTEPLMGTYVTITVLDQSQDLAQEALGRTFADMVTRIQTFNRFDCASPLAVLNSEGVLSGAPPELLNLLRESRRIHDLTSGAFDATVKPIIDLFRKKASQDKPLHLSTKERKQLLSLVDTRAVLLNADSVRFAKQGMGITLDGVAKGFIADQASALLTRLGATNHLINAGGDIRVSGNHQLDRPWAIAIQGPNNDESPDILHLRNGCVATSGAYEVSFDRHQIHHHIVNPRTATSPSSAASVTICANSVMKADALSTALFVLPLRAGYELIDTLPDTEALIITHNGTNPPTHRWGA